MPRAQVPCVISFWKTARTTVYYYRIYLRPSYLHHTSNKKKRKSPKGKENTDLLEKTIKILLFWGLAFQIYVCILKILFKNSML